MSSTTSDLALLSRKLSAEDYSPDVYVKEIANRCVGGHELHIQRKIIQVKGNRGETGLYLTFIYPSLWLLSLFQTLSEDTHSQLKRNVYQNYGQFISTAKEISFLESEMYQLSHMITEQRNILQSMAETSVLGDKVKRSRIDRLNALTLFHVPCSI